VSGTRVDGKTSSATQHQDKHSAGDGEVLLEMQQLISVGEIRVKQYRGRQTKQSQHCRPQSRMPPDCYRDAGKKL
jgi:hypothetical protein